MHPPGLACTRRFCLYNIDVSEGGGGGGGSGPPGLPINLPLEVSNLLIKEHYQLMADQGIWKGGGGGGGGVTEGHFCLAMPIYKALGLLVVISRK